MAIVGVGKVVATGKVVFGYSFTPVAAVDGVDAGEVQTVLCSSIVVLTGSVEGGVNNVFLWEQQSGDPIIIDSPTSLTTFFTNSSGSDIVVRLWVDKGEDTETYDDVEIIRTPTSWSANSSGVLADTSNPITDYESPNWKYYAAQRATQNVKFNPAESNWPPPSDADDGLSCTEISSTSLGVFWNIPTDVYPDGTATYDDYLLGLYISTVVEKYNTLTSEWEQEAEYLDGSTVRTYALEDDELYRLGSKYDFELNPVFIQYTDPFYVTDDPTQLYKTPWSSNRTATAGTLNVNPTSIKRITANPKEVPDYSSVTQLGDLRTVPGDVKRLIGVLVSLEDSNAAAQYGYSALGSVTVTRSNGGSIGG